MPRQNATSSNIPLVFDLDGTLTQTDCLWEALACLTTHHPLRLCKAAWVASSAIRKADDKKAELKNSLAQFTGISDRHIPLRQECLELLASELKSGRKCVLCTGSPTRWADEAASQIKLALEALGVKKQPFSMVLSTAPTNLIGEAKAALLANKFGEKGFDYVGNSTQDIPSWKTARTAVLAGHCLRTKKKAKDAGLTLVELSPPIDPPSWGKALRVHQWAKNLLVFIPIGTAHAYWNPLALGASIAIFTAFCLVASGNYLLNDTTDAGNDRRHPDKQHRPIANGSILIPHALLAAVLLIFSGMAVAFLTNAATGAVLVGYLLISVFYSHKGKTIPVLDTTILAALYCIRISAGATASMVPISGWLIATALFLFFSLALGKRDAELALSTPKGRGYKAGDRQAVTSLGTSAAMLACGMLCLYTQSDAATSLYSNPNWLWALPVTALYWSSRFWLLCGRNEIHQDPVLWAAKDKTSWVCAAIGGAALLLGRYTH